MSPPLSGVERVLLFQIRCQCGVYCYLPDHDIPGVVEKS